MALAAAQWPSCCQQAAHLPVLLRQQPAAEASLRCWTRPPTATGAGASRSCKAWACWAATAPAAGLMEHRRHARRRMSACPWAAPCCSTWCAQLAGEHIARAGRGCPFWADIPLGAVQCMAASGLAAPNLPPKCGRSGSSNQRCALHGCPQHVTCPLHRRWCGPKPSAVRRWWCPAHCTRASVCCGAGMPVVPAVHRWQQPRPTVLPDAQPARVGPLGCRARSTKTPPAHPARCLPAEFSRHLMQLSVALSFAAYSHLPCRLTAWLVLGRMCEAPYDPEDPTLKHILLAIRRALHAGVQAWPGAANPLAAWLPCCPAGAVQRPG